MQASEAPKRPIFEDFLAEVNKTFDDEYFIAGEGLYRTDTKLLVGWVTPVSHGWAVHLDHRYCQETVPTYQTLDVALEMLRDHFCRTIARFRYEGELARYWYDTQAAENVRKWQETCKGTETASRCLATASTSPRWWLFWRRF